VEDLEGQGLPPPGGAPGQDPGPGLGHHPELLLQVGDELLGDGVAVGPHVGGVHRVGGVVVGVRVPDGHHEHPRGRARGPEVGEAGGAPLPSSPGTKPKGGRSPGKCPRWKRTGSGHPLPRRSRREEDVGPDVHVPPPELRQEVAPDLHEPDVLRVPGVPQLQHLSLPKGLHGGDDLVQGEGELPPGAPSPPGTQAEGHHLRVDVPRRDPGVLPLPRLPVHLQDMAVGPVVGGPGAQERLDPVLSFGEVRQVRQGVSPDVRAAGGEAELVAGLHPPDVHPPEGNPAHPHPPARLR
jgi:hypothetical protein